jgi:hypothetical protein
MHVSLRVVCAIAKTDNVRIAGDLPGTVQSSNWLYLMGVWACSANEEYINAEM